MERKQRIFIGLAAIIVLLLGFTTLGSGVPGIPGVSEPDGVVQNCQVTIDKDSIISASCDAAQVCRTRTTVFDPFSFLSTTVKLKAVVGSSVYGQQSFDVSTLGVNKDVAFTACTPASADTMQLQLFNEDGGLEAARTVQI